MIQRHELLELNFLKGINLNTIEREKINKLEVNKWH